MLDLPFYLLAFIVLLGVLVVVHEFGHYIVARYCGVKVLRFSIGFGRILWLRRFGRDQTELTLCALPFGGYVRMLDEREVEEGEQILPEDLPRAFNRQTVGRRSAIVIAGPLLNLFLAFLIYWALFMAGGETLRPILGEAPPDTPAFVAGIQNGDLVRAVNGEPVTTLEDFHWRLLRHASRAAGQSVALAVENEAGQQFVRHISVARLEESGWEGNPFDLLGIRFFRPHTLPVAGEIEANAPAARAGLQAGDRIRRVDGEPIQYFEEFVERVRAAPGKRLLVEVERADELLQFDLVPENRNGIGRVGLGVAKAELEKMTPSRFRVFVRYGVLEAAARAARETWDKSIFSLSMMGRIVLGEVSWKNLSGPIMIADYAGKTASIGLDAYLKFMALVSISLGLLNLMPIPVLDGGHLMYYVVEIIKGRPLSERFMMRGQQVGMTLLFALMAFAFFNDMTRILESFTSN
ncbi:MAG: RIP metalloprotease RseP [Zoogloeaceae bacterium]|jgi:regulator of sigma E protease|nr:RIP metalloprotease RseP [Zoogloeaceae bacterium]